MITRFYSKGSNNKVIEVELFSRNCVYRTNPHIKQYPELDSQYLCIDQISITDGKGMIELLKARQDLTFICEESRYL